MCGFVGAASILKKYKQNNSFLDPSRIKHRGPDSCGVWLSKHENVIFYHNRLAVIDVSDGSNQPLSSDCGKFTIAFNGEIYNYLDIKKKLECAGCFFFNFW